MNHSQEEVSLEDTAIYFDYGELAEYLGQEFDLFQCNSGDDKIHKAEATYPNTDEFVRDTMVFCYQNIGLLVQGISRPYIAKLLEMCANWNGPRVIDVFAGGGQLGLALHTLGFRVSFTDLRSRSLEWLKWRLKKRGLQLPVYDWDNPEEEIPLHDFAVCFDVLEHLAFDEQCALLERLAQIGRIVLINLIDDRRPEMSAVHLEMRTQDVIDWIKARWRGGSWPYYPDENGDPRQWLVIYGQGVKGKQ